MNSVEGETKGKIILERALLISPTSLGSEIPEDQASQDVTIETLRALENPSIKQRVQKALGFQSLK